MTYYNLTNITDANTTIDILQNMNLELTGGYFSLLIVISFFIILYLNFEAGSTKETFFITSFLTSILSGLLFLAGLVPFFIMIVCILMTFIGVVLFFLTE